MSSSTTTPSEPSDPLAQESSIPELNFIPPGADMESASHRNAFVHLFPENFPVPLRLKNAPAPLVNAVNDFHYAMINDTHRNHFYYRMLKRSIKPGVTGVLEIGAGSGLLSMLAAQLGAPWVVAVEGSPEMASFAQRIIDRNGFADRITVLTMLSTELQRSDLPAVPDVLVSELFGTLLLGESVHDYLDNLRHRHVIGPRTRILPPKGVQYAVPLECPSLDGITRARNYKDLDLSHVNSLQDTISTVFTKQLGFRLNTVPFWRLAEPIPLISMNFEVPCNPQLPSDSRRISFIPTQSGTAHAMLLYWSVMDDEHHIMSTDPVLTKDNFERDMQWGQAIQLLINEEDDSFVNVNPSNSIAFQCIASSDGVLLHFSPK